MTISLRDATPEDEPFLRQLIVEIILAELPVTGPLLEMQYRSRRHASGNRIVMRDNEPAGLLVAEDLPDHIRIVEIMVSARVQSQGTGTAVLRQILEGAQKPIRLLVNASNTRAIALYRRLGFQTIETGEVQHLMQCAAPAQPGEKSPGRLD